MHMFFTQNKSQFEPPFGVAGRGKARDEFAGIVHFEFLYSEGKFLKRLHVYVLYSKKRNK